MSEAVGVEIELAGIPVGAEASIGWTMYPEDSDDARTLLQYADVAMYAAKTGRIDLIRYDPELDRFDPSRLGLVSDLRRAIGSDELELYYQPKIEIATGLVTSFEALIRWNHPTRGLLSPAEFLPIAESTGLIGPLTNWVVNEAVWQIARWGAQYQALHLAVNISARNLRDEHLAEYVFERLRNYEVHPTQLLLELTETSVVTDHARAEHLLRTLRERWCACEHRRLRPGLHLARVPGSPPRERAEDRPHLRGRDAVERRGPCHRRVGDRARTPARAHRGRRRCGDRSGAARARRSRLRHRPGLLLRPPDEGRRRARLARASRRTRPRVNTLDHH